ncbi:MAG: PilX N-terminal domain-containing pilus assembly protein [candidate division Zixibacteria bacterium]
MFRVIKNEKGMALFIALMLTLMLTIIGIGIIKTSNDEISIAGNEMNEMVAFYTAEAGLEKAAAALQTYYEEHGAPPETMPSGSEGLPSANVAYVTTDNGAFENKKLAQGDFAGLHASVKTYTIESIGTSLVDGSQVRLYQEFECALVPIFQFAVFYENDLEIAPGPTMVINGRIHSNKNIYLQSGNSLDINSYLTSYGSIYHGRKPGSGAGEANGEVNILGMDGNYYSMRDGSDWLDANDDHWFDTASTRWGGRVKDSDFGQEKLRLPFDNPDEDAHKIINRASFDGGNNESFEHNAAFKIIDGQALYDVGGGSWVNVTANLLADGSLKESTFHDKRENKDAVVYDIDMNIFKNSAYFPSNGNIYTADNRTGLRGTRIYNAEDIGASLTIASENPVYTMGDINSNNKKPMAIIADALTILSGNWLDDPLVSGSDDKNNRTALSTTANFSFITGNKNSGEDGAGYNGGLENLPRFLENWSDRTLTYRGSMICLWVSQEAIGNWDGTYYTPPNRDWAFDTDLTDPGNLPPGTPSLRVFQRVGWRQDHVDPIIYHTLEEITDPAPTI